ncbi:NAD(P)/FAD-dependent oxidoreductase [Rathayibacter soli]|uniref:NAD(P)/FAD-dependent oxidoreductase n=1 Tax=Rathayibacter soli TaxID=3144168 RepID=UPI0027E4347D|nr:FAD-dependent oxidoreductase [Glaciibacter superstes]
MSEQEFVIVGGGLTAATAAETLRAEGFDGRVRIVASEAHHPYLRPPLSKEYFKGDATRDTIFVKPAEWYDENKVELLLNTPATALDVAAHEVVLGSGDRLHYDKLLLATGASSRHLHVPNYEATGIYYLRTVEESEALRDALSVGGKNLVIVGSGWIGLEIAAAARGYGNNVTVIGMENVALSVALGDELGGVFEKMHRENGVQFRLPASLKEFEAKDGHVTGVVIEGETLPADLVVVGAGAIPNVDLAQAAGLTINRGVETDERLHTSAADVFAAGDVANAYHPVVKVHMRNEHWANAINAGKVAAKSMLGQDVVFDDIPYFYTDQYDLGMEYAGYPTLTSDATIVYRGDPATREFIAFWQAADGRVVAGMNVNVWDVSEDIQSLIRSARVVDAARLADASVPIAEV